MIPLSYFIPMRSTAEPFIARIFRPDKKLWYDFETQLWSNQLGKPLPLPRVPEIMGLFEDVAIETPAESWPHGLHVHLIYQRADTPDPAIDPPIAVVDYVHVREWPVEGYPVMPWFLPARR
jgi:hypothetical protein